MCQNCTKVDKKCDFPQQKVDVHPLQVIFDSVVFVKKTQKSIKLSKARDYFRRDEPEKKTIISGHEETRKGPGKMGSPMRLPFHCSWLVVSIHVKNISQWEGLSHILWKIKNVPNHHVFGHVFGSATCSGLRARYGHQCENS